jgi:hypothetical protein
VTVESNNVHDNGGDVGLDTGIGSYNANDVIIRYNNVHDNYHGGVYVVGNSIVTGCKVYYNLICNNGRSTSVDVNHDALRVNLCNGLEMYNNVIYGNNCNVTGSHGAPGGIHVNTYTTNMICKNNIVMNNMTTSGAQLYVEPGSGAGSIFANNIYWDSAGGTPKLVNWQGTVYTSDQEASYRSAHEANAYFRDPGFVNAAIQDFRLLASSVALNSGMAVGLTRDYAGNPVPVGGVPDRGAYETPVTIQGTITLQNFVGDNTTVSVTFEILVNPVETHTVTLDAAGHYTFTTFLQGTYAVTAKASHWLKSKKTVTVSQSVAADFSLINGDCDNDNAVTANDLSLLLAVMDAMSGSPGFDARADLDGDGEITSSDLAIILAGLGLNGE